MNITIYHASWYPLAVKNIVSMSSASYYFTNVECFSEFIWLRPLKFPTFVIITFKVILVFFILFSQYLTLQDRYAARLLSFSWKLIYMANLLHRRQFVQKNVINAPLSALIIMGVPIFRKHPIFMGKEVNDLKNWFKKFKNEKNGIDII